MTYKVQEQDVRIHYLYRITNKINGKIYIGQTVEPDKRWYQHRRDAANPKYPLHFAINKYGVDNFDFEIIVQCKTWDDANEVETFLVSQYDSLVVNGKGYNISLGGYNAPKSEEWKQSWQKWWTSLSPDKKEEILNKRSVSYLKYLAENGHPCLGQKRTDEQRANISVALKALDKTTIYTPEVRKNMSEAHIGIKDTEETKQRKSESAFQAWEDRIDFSRKCSAPGCEVSGKAKYKIINGIRYCNKHGLRMLRNGILDCLPSFKYADDNPMPEDVRKKCGIANIGKVVHNRIIFTSEQMAIILSDNRSNRKIAKDFGVTEKVIKRIKDENTSK